MKFPALSNDAGRAIAPGGGSGLRDAAVPLACVLLAAVGAWGAWWLRGPQWLPSAIAAAGVAVAGWRACVGFAALRRDLTAALRDRAAMEASLLQSQKMEALGRLTVGIAHDFNNHLTVISSNVELVRRRLDGGQERLRRHSDAALQGVQRAAALTGRLMSLSRQSVAEPEVVDVRRLLTGLSDLLRRTLGEGVALVIEHPDETWSTWADVTMMENALLSLAVNVRAKIPKGGRLILAVSNTRLDAASVLAHPVMLPGDYVQIWVGGRRPATGEVPWQPADDLTSADLSMARAFVREAGGVLLRSDPATVGLALRLFLPRFQPRAIAAAQRAHRADGRATILVVEDDESVRQACVEALQDLDYAILEAPDAMEAFRLIADHGGIDLLLTDLGLPNGVSGRALAEAARNVDRGIRVLFTTGYERADLGGMAADLLLRKPFSAEQLAHRVAEALRDRVATREAKEGGALPRTPFKAMP